MLNLKTLRLILFTGVLSYGSLFAQFSWNVERVNLQVLPDSVSADNLRNIMVGFAGALGVRCNYCHDDSKGQKLSEIDFASDKKPQKNITREMMRMTGMINTQFIENIRKTDPKAVEVSCQTCHHGYKEPKQLAVILNEAYHQNGLPAALSQYDSLKSKYYGASAFDFSERSLNDFGYLVLSQNTADAITIFKLNVQYFPASANVYDSLGEAYLKAGDTENARLNYEKSIEIQPNNFNAAKILNTLKDRQ